MNGRRTRVSTKNKTKSRDLHMPLYFENEGGKINQNQKVVFW